jgi:hypothetical protein
MGVVTFNGRTCEASLVKIRVRDSKAVVVEVYPQQELLQTSYKP